MTQIQFIIKKNAFKAVPPNYSVGELENCLVSLDKQVKAFNINCSITPTDIKDVPRKTDAFLVCFLDENSLIPNDYLIRITSMSNLYRDSTCFCGPVSTHSVVLPNDWFLSRILQSYKNYNLKWFNEGVFIINKDTNVYPPLEGCIFSGYHYNLMGGYVPTESPRGLIERNNILLSKIDSCGLILYCSKLQTGLYISGEEFTLENFNKYFYNMGYMHGGLVTDEEFNKKFLVNHNMLEIENLSWIEENEKITKENKIRYGKQVAIIKCMYELGYYEAMTRSKII